MEAVLILSSTLFEGLGAGLHLLRALRSGKKFHEHLSAQGDTEAVASYSFYRHS